MKKFLLIVLIVAVIGVGALFIFKGKAVVRRSKHLLSEFKEATIRKVDITFELTESGVSIALDNEAPVLKSEKITLFTLEKGMHHFSFSKEGYEKLEKEIDAVENATISISLTKIKIIETVKHIPQPGYIKINSNPEGAAILINNKQKAVTPATIKLDAGKYTVKVQMKNYHEFSLKFSLKEAETKTFDTIELLPKFAYYSVDIAPAKAKIYLDNFLVGNTRIEKTTLSSGKHNLVIKADQYYDFKQDFKVKDGEYKQFDVKLKATFGSLAVNSEPEEGANVYIDEQIAGQTPYLDEHVLPGQYRVRVEKKLCIGTEKILTVYEDERTSETLVMTKNYALVTVDSPGSEIFINNDKVGVDHCEVKLEKGQYQVKCSKENYHWVVETINADPAKDIYLQMDPEPMMASLNVESKPIESLGSQVWVNDEKKEATTPGAFDLVPGEYDVSVKHKYFYDKTKHISLSPNDHNIMVFEMEALKGSPIAQSIRWKRSKWTSFTTTMLLVGAGEYYNYQGELAYDDYNRANTTSDAIRLRKDCDDLLQKRDYAYSFSVVPAAWFFYSWLKQSHYQKKATE